MKILEAEGTAGLFEEIVTKDSRAPAYQDKQEMMRYLLQKWEIAPGECLMIGDTMEDAEAASKTGMQFCFVTHGYGAVPESSAVPVAFRIGHFSELVPHGGTGVSALIDKDIFEDLFVLEMANNHLGSVERGLKIIQEFAQIVRFNNVRASIKLQFRDVENFVHKDFPGPLRPALREEDAGYAADGRPVRHAGESDPAGGLHCDGDAVR